MDDAPAASTDDMREFIARIELVSFDTMHVEAGREGGPLPDEVAIRVETQPVTYDHEGALLTIRYAHRATYTATVGGDPTQTESPEAPILGQVVALHLLTLTVEGDEPLHPETVQAFATTDGYFMAFPYVRQTLQSLAASVGLPPLVLPILRRAVQ